MTAIDLGAETRKGKQAAYARAASDHGQLKRNFLCVHLQDKPQFDAVWENHVLEHTDKPALCFAKTQRLHREDSVLSLQLHPIQT